MLFNCKYRIYSINHPGRLLNFWPLRVGAYSRLGAYSNKYGSYFTGISSLNVVSEEYNYIVTETDKLGLVQLTMESSDIELNSYFYSLDGRTGPGPSSQEEGLLRPI